MIKGFVISCAIIVGVCHPAMASFADLGVHRTANRLVFSAIEQQQQQKSMDRKRHKRQKDADSYREERQKRVPGTPMPPPQPY